MKQLESKPVKVGNNTYYIKPFGAFYAANLSGEIVSLVAPILSGLLAVIPSGDKEVSLNDIKADDALPLLSSALSNLDGDKIETLLNKLLISTKNISVSYVNENGKTEEDILSWDLANELFCLEVNNLYVLTWEVIKLNYGGFFGSAPDLFGKVVGKQKTQK